MKADNQKLSVLIVDWAIDFGGSIVSTANLIRGIDRSKFEPILVTAAPEDFVRRRLMEASDCTHVVIARKALHYARIAAIVRVAFKLKPVALRKAAQYALYVIRLFVNTPYALRLAWLIRKHRIDLVQLNNGFGNDELEIVCRLLNTPRVVFFRGYIPLSAIERRLFLKGVRGFVSVSEYVKSDAVADGVPEQLIHVVTPPAVPEPISDALRAAVRGRYGVKDGELVFGIFGRIVDWKGQREFVHAAAIALKAHPASKAFIVGDTSDGEVRYLNEVRSLTRELGIESQVIFTGFIDQVHELYSIMDVVVHASIEPEPSGRVIFEAMSFAIPVIASCYGGPKEFICHGVDGFICDPKRPTQLAEYICTLLGSDTLRQELGGKAQEKVLARHNKAAYAAKVQQIYLRCLDRSW